MANTFKWNPRYSQDVCQAMRDVNALEASVAVGLSTEFEYTDFSDVTGLNIVGDAAQDSNAVRLVNGGGTEKGALWYATRVDVTQPWRSTFDYKVIKGLINGGDGFTFAAQNNSDTALVGTGGAIGIYFDNAVWIEWDVYQNALPTFPQEDPNANHIAVHKNPVGDTGDDLYGMHGTADLLGQNTSPGHTIEDSVTRTAVVNWSGDLLSLDIDAASILSDVPVDIDAILTLQSGTDGYVGFTAATGVDTVTVWIYSWLFETGSPMTQTEWYAYKRDMTKVSLGTPDGGVSVPALQALSPSDELALVAPDHIADLRTAIETLAPYFENGVTSNPFNWTDSSADNLYFVAMGDRTAYGATGGAAYDWTRTKAAMLGTPTYDIDIGEIRECIDKLEASSLV